ncbi:MAG: hypothetical protein D6791_14880 [Chloroflexi bacterium]|nr:MAG: hypothetical protein D6791_14880 [Chloroflexota bacterium]
MHDIEVDQSGRTDVLTDDTVLAFSDSIQSAVLIPARVKRQCYRQLKAAGMRKRLIGVKLFAAGLVLLLQPHIVALEMITIDVEYEGWEPVVKEHLLRHLRQVRPDLSNWQITFRRIGKGARAHDVALATFRGDREPDYQIGVEELLAVC